MEASTLSHAARRGLLTRKSPLLKLKGDEQLVAMVRSGNSGAFDIIVDRYQPRLLGFCRQMIGSTEDAEDVLQEVFINAHKAMLADNREINLKPWLYRIARNRSLNHLRKPKADCHESMDMVPMVDAGSTAEKVHNREEFRQLLNDVTKLPETQRAALLLREIDALSYEEIAEAMDTSVPSVKSLLVRARISLAEASQSRMLTCGEVRVELAEAAEGLTKASGPVRRHVRDCEECATFRKQLRSDSKVLAMIMPVGPIIALKALLGAKLGLGGSAAGTAGSAGTAGTAAGTAAAGSAAAGTSAGAAIGAGGAVSGGIGALSSAIGIKAVAGVVTAAVITAGAVEVSNQVAADRPAESPDPSGRTFAAVPPVQKAPEAVEAPAGNPTLIKAEAPAPVPVVDDAPEAVLVSEEVPAEEIPPVVEEPVVEHPDTGAAVPAKVKPTDDGLEGTIVDIPVETKPLPPTDPQIPVETKPGTVGQVINPPVTPPSPPTGLPNTPAPSTPAPVGNAPSEPQPSVPQS
jgi:RNA polymerase sigma factor (sigma-70 family)